MINVNVSAPDDASPEDVAELAKRLGAVGLQVDQTMPEMGIITGAVEDAAVLDAVHAAAGDDVTVEENRDFQLPPPDDPVQ